jgi:hypothetical protein
MYSLKRKNRDLPPVFLVFPMLIFSKTKTNKLPKIFVTCAGNMVLWTSPEIIDSQVSNRTLSASPPGEFLMFVH